VQPRGATHQGVAWRGCSGARRIVFSAVMAALYGPFVWEHWVV